MSRIDLCREILWHTVPFCLPLIGVVVGLVVLDRLAVAQEVQGE